MHVPPTPETPRKRHRVRNWLLGTLAVLVALAVIGALTGNHKPPAAQSPPSPQVTQAQQPAGAVSPRSPSPGPAHHRRAAKARSSVLLRMSGSGIQNSAPFLVTSGTLTVRYSYDCSSSGGSGNFVADLETGNQSSLSSDDQSIANALGTGGSATTTVYPQDTGSDYHLAVDSECDWSVTVKQGG
jgi:hypothetical protein